MRRVLTVLAAGLVLAPASSAHARTGTTGRLLVTLERPAGTAKAQAAAVHAIAASTGARPGPTQAPQIGLTSLTPPRGTSPRAFARQLRRRPGVARVEAERRFALRYRPDDPALTIQEPAAGAPPGTPVQWWADRQNLPAAWELDRGGDATVAIIDVGIDGGHPELGGRIREAVDNDATSGHGGALTDESGHGTHVSSMACAAGDNGIGLVGAGLNCSLLVYKTDLSTGSVAQSIVQATDAGAQAINMSFGTDGSEPAAQAIVDAIEYAYGRDVVMAAAAADQPTEEQGDPSNVLQPTGTGPDITQGKGLSVTAANFNDGRASFAGRGTQISMAAYGAFQRPNGPIGIFGAFPANTTDLERSTVVPPSSGCGCRTSFQGDSRYAYIQGTSMASPMVAGVAALVRSYNPDLHAADVIRLLKETARRLPGQGWNAETGWGILDGGAAMKQAGLMDRRAPASRVTTTPKRARRTSITLRWKGSDTAAPKLTPRGIARFDLYRSTNGGPFHRIARTKARKLRLRLVPGRRYAFYTVAVDAAGNREAAPSRPDARLTVLRQG